jgi:hypothetical protein
MLSRLDYSLLELFLGYLDARECYLVGTCCKGSLHQAALAEPLYLAKLQFDATEPSLCCELTKLAQGTFVVGLVESLNSGSLRHKRKAQFIKEFQAALASAESIKRYERCLKAMHSLIDDTFFAMFTLGFQPSTRNYVLCDVNLITFVAGCHMLLDFFEIGDYERCLRRLRERRCNAQSLLPEVGVLYAMILRADRDSSFVVAGASRKLLLRTFSNNQTVLRAERWTIGSLGRVAGDSPFRGRDIRVNKQIRAFQLLDLLPNSEHEERHVSTNTAPAAPECGAQDFCDFMLVSSKMMQIMGTSPPVLRQT